MHLMKLRFVMLNFDTEDQSIFFYVGLLVWRGLTLAARPWSRNIGRAAHRDTDTSLLMPGRHPSAAESQNDSAAACSSCGAACCPYSTVVTYHFRPLESGLKSDPVEQPLPWRASLGLGLGSSWAILSGFYTYIILLHLFLDAHNAHYVVE